MVKRYVIPGIIAALLAVSLLPAPTYTYVVRELSQTFSALQTFSSGLNVSGGDINLVSGQRVMLEGLTGDSYIVWDEDTHQVHVYNNGAVTARITDQGVMPGDCPSNPWSLEPGTSCRDSKGRTVTGTPAGPVVASGGVVGAP